MNGYRDILIEILSSLELKICKRPPLVGEISSLGPAGNSHVTRKELLYQNLHINEVIVSLGFIYAC